MGAAGPILAAAWTYWGHLMTTENETDEFEEPVEDEDFDEDALDLDDDVEIDEKLDEEIEEIDDDDLAAVDEDFVPVIDGDDEDEDDDDEAEAEAGDDDEETAEALDELEAEELELLDEEVEDALLVDEAAELRAIRREELTLNVDAQIQRSDEFVCQSCFLVKRSSQLANRRKMICRDCAE